jgi:hypothetical protein
MDLTLTLILWKEFEIFVYDYFQIRKEFGIKKILGIDINRIWLKLIIWTLEYPLT